MLNFLALSPYLVLENYEVIGTYILISSFCELWTVNLTPLDYINDVVFATNFLTASDSTLSWLSQLLTLFHSLTISMLVSQSL